MSKIQGGNLAFELSIIVNSKANLYMYLHMFFNQSYRVTFWYLLITQQLSVTRKNYLTFGIIKY